MRTANMLILFLVTLIQRMPDTLSDKNPEAVTSWSVHIDVLDWLRSPLEWDRFIIDCTLPPSIPCASNSAIKLLLGDTLVSKGDCHTSDTNRGGHRFEYTLHSVDSPTFDKRIFTELQCKYVVNITNSSATSLETYSSQEPVTIPFLYCQRESSECKQARCPMDDGRKRYCMRTAQNTRQCEHHFDPDWCSADTQPVARYCPVDENGFCAAMAKNPADIWYSTGLQRQCLNKSSNVSWVSYKGKPLMMGDHIVIDAENRALRIDCPIGTPLYDYEIYKPRKGYELCRGHLDIEFDIPKINSVHTVATKYWMVFASKKDEDTRLLKFLYKAISLGNVSLSIKAINLNAFTNKLNCRKNLAFMDQVFQVRFWWTRKMSDLSRLQGDSDRYISTLDVNETDEYQCHVDIVFKSCTPYFEHTHTVHSDWFKYEHVAPPVTKRATASRAGNKFQLLLWACVTVKKAFEHSLGVCDSA